MNKETFKSDLAEKHKLNQETQEFYRRDRNGASNIYKIAYQAIHKIARPTYLCRETSNHTALPSSKKQTLHGYVKTRP